MSNIPDVKKRAIESTLYTLSDQGFSQLIRLAGNLILTRLLIPELFGLMAIVNVLVLALGLFSDIGTGPGVIRSKRGLEPNFLYTAWTMRVIRGFVLWMLTFLIAYPAALFYHNPILIKIIPVVGFGFVLSGFSSMSVVTLNKKLRLRSLVLMRLGSQAIGLLSMLFLAYYFRNIWSLVMGGLVGMLVSTVWSHRLERDLKHRFILERSATLELFHFGKWIFLSTVMMFLATQADRLLLGRLFPLALLGVYSIAVGFAELPKNIVNTISSNVIFPVLSLYSHLPLDEMRKKLLEKRKWILFPLALLVALFSGFGDYLIYFLYDDRYREAGWILPMLAIGMWPLLLYASIDRVLYVVENPKYPALGNCCKFVYMLVCLPVAYTLWGKFAAVLVVACNDIPMYLVVNYGLRRKGLSGARQDILATFALLVLSGMVLLVRYYLGIGFPGTAAFVP